MELLNATGAGELEHIKVKEYIKVEKKSQTSLGRINKYMCRSYSGNMFCCCSEKREKLGGSKEISFSLILPHMVGATGKVDNITRSVTCNKNLSTSIKETLSR